MILRDARSAAVCSPFVDIFNLNGIEITTLSTSA